MAPPPPRATHEPGDPPEEGPAPDPRELLANERTFLAWVRTALALLAAAAAVTAVDLPMSAGVQRFLSVVLSVVGLLSIVQAWLTWRRRDDALHRAETLPPPRGMAILMGGLLLVGVVLVAAVLA